MKTLQRIYREKPDSKKADLSFHQLEEVDTLFEHLYKLKNLQELNLACNRLERLPIDMSILKSLKSIDISSNFFTSNNEVLKSLKTIPELVQLKMNLTPEEESIFLRELPNLEKLNSKVLKRITIERDGVERLNEDFQDRRENIKRLREKRLKMASKPLTLEMEDTDNPQLILGHLEEAIKHAGIGESFKNMTANFQAKYSNQMNIIKEWEARGRTVALEQSFDIISARYGLFEPILSEYCKAAGYFSDELERGLRLIFSCFNKINESWHEYGLASTEVLKDKDISSVVNQQGSKSKRGTDAFSNLNTQKETWILKQNELENQINELQEDNRRCYELIIKLSKKQAMNEIDLEYLQTRNTKAIKEITPLEQVAARRKPKRGEDLVLGSRPRVITASQMMDIIDDIFTQKKLHDEKCLTNKLPLETMEQYLYIYLSNKYGLKSLVIEWASSIISMIPKLSSESSEVLLFGKVMRNEIDEDFYQVHKEVKTTVYTMYEAFLRTKHPYMKSKEIKEKIEKKLNGLIQKQECIEILKPLYDEQDFNRIRVLLDHEFAQEQLHRTKQKGKIKLQGKYFMKLILDYQLRSHEEYIQSFLELFKRLDSDNDGVVTHTELRRIVENIRHAEVGFNVIDAIKQIDPNDVKQVPFSQCVRVLNVIPCDGESNMSVFQKYSQ